MSPKPWSEEHLAILKEMSAAGHHAQDIANAVGRSKNAVIGQWKRLGDQCPHADEHGHVWNSHDVDKLRKMWISSVPVPDIAKALNRSSSAVRDKLRRLGQAPRTPEHPSKQIKRRVVAKPPPSAKPPPASLIPQRGTPSVVGNPIRFLDREFNQCGFVIGEVNGAHTMICGNPIALGSYCLTHHHICHIIR